MTSDTFSKETRERFADTPLWKPWMSEVRLRQATSREDIEEFLEQGSGKERISWDVETKSLNPDPQEVVGHSIAFDENEGLYIPVRHRPDPDQNLDPDMVWEMVTQAIQEPKVLVVYNYRFEGAILRRAGYHRPARHDIMRDGLVYNWLYDSNQKQLNLKTAVKNHCGWEMLEIDEVPGSKRDRKKNGVIDFSYTTPAEAVLYAAADPVMTLRLLAKQEQRVLSQQRFITELEHSLLEPLFSMETNSVTIDRAFLRQGKKDLLHWIDVITTKILDKAGYDFNIGSSAEVGKFLKNQGVKLGETKTGKTATSAKVVEKLAPNYPIIQDILLWRSLVKELGTYVETLLNCTNDDYPFATFKFRSVGVPTGRLASGGVKTGEINFAPVNVQSIPSADAYRLAACRLISNPPLEDMDGILRGYTDKLDIAEVLVEAGSLDDSWQEE